MAQNSSQAGNVFTKDNGDLTLLGAGAAGPVGSWLYNNVWQGDKSRLAEIKKAQEEALNSPYNTAKVTPENQHVYDLWASEYANAKNEAKYGLSDAEKAEAMQNYTGAVNLNYQNAINQSGGQFAPYLNAVMNTGASKFATSLSAQDAALKRQKQMNLLNYLGGMQNAAGTFQDVFNQNFNKQMLAEQALGQAEADWRYNNAQDRRALLGVAGSLAGVAAKGAMGV